MRPTPDARARGLQRAARQAQVRLERVQVRLERARQARERIDPRDRDANALRRPREREGTYWSQTRRPFPCLIFVLPILLVYEAGVSFYGAGTIRTGADAWVRSVLRGLGLMDRWLLPLLLVVAVLCWQALDARSWRCRPWYLLGMVCESLILAICLIGLNKIVDLAFERLDAGFLLAGGATANPETIAAVLGFLGAGVYEEALFRLGLIPILYQACRLLQAPGVLAGTLAVTGSSVLFSMAHHIGQPGEPFTWYAFIFRWLAGIAFAGIFQLRGFGIAVGTHVTYDLLVGCLGWRI